MVVGPDEVEWRLAEYEFMAENPDGCPDCFDHGCLVFGRYYKHPWEDEEEQDIWSVRLCGCLSFELTQDWEDPLLGDEHGPWHPSLPLPRVIRSAKDRLVEQLEVACNDDVLWRQFKRTLRLEQTLIGGITEYRTRELDINVKVFGKVIDGGR